jgi:hypothetical protein
MPLFEQLIDAGVRTLDTAPNGDAPVLSSATLNQRAQIADSHYLVGLGQLGLNNRDQARQEFSLALKASPDHDAAMRALKEMGLMQNQFPGSERSSNDFAAPVWNYIGPHDSDHALLGLMGQRAQDRQGLAL